MRHFGQERYRQVFDLDHTLLFCNISFEFGKHLYRRGFFSFPTFCRLLSYYLRFKYFNLSVAELHAQVFEKLFLGRRLKDIEQEADLFLENLSRWLNPKVAALLEEESLILSSSPDFLVERVARRLNVKGKGTGYSVDKEGKLCEVSFVMEGSLKAHYLPEGPSIYYTDSILDLPVMLQAGRVVAVRPDRQLRKLAKEKNWEIID